MDAETPRRIVYPSSGIGNAEALITNSEPITALTEEFEDQLRFCLNLSDGPNMVTQIYGSDQIAFNNHSAAITLAIAELLLQCGNDPGRLRDLWQDYWKEFRRLQGREFKAREFVPDVILESPVEYLFACLGVLRRCIAWEVQAEHSWHQYGRNRYENRGQIATCTSDNRYAPSIARCDIERMKDIYRNYAREREGPEISETFNQYLKELSYFEIVKTFSDKKLVVGNLKNIGDRGEIIYNYCVRQNDYEAIFAHIDALFLDLLDDPLLPPWEFLDRVFRIQYWFIHIMPFYRGSLAVMNLFRYAMTAYYNHRARIWDRPLLPIVPTRKDYFPDLEALLNCLTEDDFVAGSMTEYYCVNFAVLCGDAGPVTNEDPGDPYVTP